MSRFILGNCVDIMSGFPERAVDFILTDPPYLVGFRDRSGRSIAGDKTDEWLQPACNEMYRVLKKDALMVSFYGWNRVDRFMAAWKSAGFSVVGYFRLRTAQQVLCVSYSVPLAIFLTTAFSPFGTWSGLWFFNYVVALMALSWGGLALYTRETDRVRQLADSREVTIRNGRRVVVARMKAHEKARLVWEVLLDDDVIRRQLQVWWHGTARFLAFSIRYLSAAVLMTVWLVFWLIPDVAGEIVEQIRECPADRVVRWAAGALTSMYVITGLAWVIWNVQMDRLPVNCFREDFLAKVAAYQQCGDEMSASGTDAPLVHTELRGDGK